MALFRLDEAWGIPRRIYRHHREGAFEGFGVPTQRRKASSRYQRCVARPSLGFLGFSGNTYLQPPIFFCPLVGTLSSPTSVSLVNCRAHCQRRRIPLSALRIGCHPRLSSRVDMTTRQTFGPWVSPPLSLQRGSLHMRSCTP